jgi:hypothetical protein
MDKNQIDRINGLISEKGMTQKEFTIAVLNHSGQKGQDIYEKQKANFSKMLSGERKFPIKYILGIERTLHTSWNYIIDGQGFDKTFEQKGIRYAAYKGTYHDFELLGQELSHDDNVIKNYDEYNNTILDYILDYRAIEGLRYLNDNKLVEVQFDLKQITGPVMSSRGPEKACHDCLLLVCEKDDEKLFSSMYNPYRLLTNYCDKNGTVFNDPNVLKAILEAKKIFNSLLKETTFTWVQLSPEFKGTSFANNKSNLCPPLLGNLLVYALNDTMTYQKQINELLEFGKSFNERRIKEIEAMPEKDSSVLSLQDDGSLNLGRHYIGNFFTYRLTEQLDLPADITRELHEINDQVNKVKFQRKPLGSGLSRGDCRIEDGKLVKRSSNNKDEYAFLKLMADKGIKETPRLLKQENGLDYLTYFKGESAYSIYEMPINKTIAMVKLLRKMNDISKEALGNDKVYVHGDLSGTNVVFDGDTVTGILNWDNTHIGNEYEDFIYIVWTWLNIGDFARNNEMILKNLLVLLQAYDADAAFKKDFAYKMVKVMDDRLAATPKDSLSYASIFQLVGWSKIWVELMKDEITRKVG